MRIRNAAVAFVCACATGQTVLAHPGHTVQPAAPHGLSHYLTHPDHLAQWLIVAVVIGAGVWMIRAINRPAMAYARKKRD